MTDDDTFWALVSPPTQEYSPCPCGRSVTGQRDGWLFHPYDSGVHACHTDSGTQIAVHIPTRNTDRRTSAL